MDKKFVTYLEFGAVGDGVHDDFEAIYRAHEYANANGLPVVTNDDKTYYIHETRIDGEVKSAIIKTDVNWGTSKFIIDDTDIISADGTGRHGKHIFRAVSDYEMQTFTEGEILTKLAGIGEGTKKVDLALGYPAMIVVYDNEQRVFRRSGSYGPNSKVGTDAHELIVIDAEGNVDESTPFMFNYPQISKLEILRIDIKPITVSGGEFTTRASRMNAWDPETQKIVGSYIARGLAINRSYTTVCGVKHYVVGDITTYEHRDKKMRGAHYNGFYAASYANEVTIKDCVFTGRRYYRLAGTYEFSGHMVNKIRLIGCTQSNFQVEAEDGTMVYSMSVSPVSGTLRHWGIGGTNFCKNMEYINSKLSRFDAHQGLYHGKMVGCTMNFMELTGKGDLLIEGLDWYSANPGETYNSLAYLRGDYGCTWDGTITIKDCTANVERGDFYIVQHSYGNWYYGYDCVFPNLIIDNLKIKGLDEGAKVHLMTESRSVKKEPNLHLPVTLNTLHDNEDGTKDNNNANMIVPPKFIKVINNNSGYDILLPKASFFDNTEKVGLVEVDMENL